MSTMNLRLTTTLLLVVLAMSGCASDEDVPEDQALRPASAPSGWTTNDLGPVSVATPAEWEKQPPAKPTQTMTTTTWRAKEVDGTSPGGMEVRVITKPQQGAKKAAQALAVSAMASLAGGDIEPEKIVWPNAELAYYLAYTAKVPVETDPAAPKKSYIARTAVFDLADGSQIQVTALVDEAQGAKVPEQALSTVKFAES
ncbi:hypothetical protein [Aeromicrobium sp.]|uniref:hypothetical protein n=1 Tax=Aeromicrobium sp. TaxID=1871063 RepID=UPI003D6C4B97